MSYIGNTPGVSSQRVVLEEVITGSPKSAFVPISGYIQGYVDVLINGVEIDTADFTAADGVTVTLGTAAAVGDTVKIKTWLPRGLSDGYLKSEADALFFLKSGGSLTGGLTAAGNLLMTANDGNARVVGVSNGTNTTLVLQGGGNGAGALGGNIELGRDGNNMYDAGVSRFRSLDGSTTYGQFDANGLGMSKAVKIVYSGMASPATTTDLSATAGFSMSLGGGDYFAIGQYSNSKIWLQGAYGANPSLAKYNLVLQPLGGNVEIGNGNLVMASGKGIDFSANANAGGMTGEVFDDYETGTWTPIMITDGGGHSVTHTVQRGVYTKVGRVVTVSWYVAWLAFTGGSAGVRISNLPFLSQNSGPGVYYTGANAEHSSSITYPASMTTLTYEIAQNATTLLPVLNGSGAGTVGLTRSYVGTGSGYFIGSVTYDAA